MSLRACCSFGCLRSGVARRPDAVAGSRRSTAQDDRHSEVSASHRA